MKEFCASTIGKKYLMGLSGLIWVGFVFVHMLGNLLIFVSPQAYNSYGHALTSGKIVYVIEALLLFSFLSHVFMGIHLTIKNKMARPRGYAESGTKEKGASLASKTMAIHGSIILIFIISHLFTFKFGPEYQTTVDGVMMRDLYKILIEVFKQPGYFAWYFVSLLLLGFHLSHGVGSVFQSFGLLHPAYQATIKKISCLYSFVVAAGFISQPIYIFFFAN